MADASRRAPILTSTLMGPDEVGRGGCGVVYKAHDPRAAELKQLAKQLADDTNQTELYEKSKKIEEVMEKAVAAKGIYANVDFYSATTYHCLGLDLDLFTPMFAMSRTAGWAGHVIEQLEDNRLFRPKAEYIGPHDVAYESARSGEPLTTG